MKAVSIVCLTLLFFSLQHVSGQKLNSKEKVRLDEAVIDFEIYDYVRARKVFIKYLDKAPSSYELHHKIGICHYNLDATKDVAKSYFLKGIEETPESWFYLGQCYHLNEQFDSALISLRIYMQAEDREHGDDEVKRNIAISNRAKEMIADPVDVKIYNIGPNLNTEYDEYAPLITADESMMVFTSRRAGSTGERTDPYGKYFEDIYSSLNNQGDWLPAEKISENINTGTHDAAVGLSADGNTIIVYRTNKKITGGDLHYSNFEDNRWSTPRSYGESINSEWQEASASLSADGRVMYFSSNRPGGYGGKDIYRIVKLGNNKWSLPMNLGSEINTPYDEDAPFFHPDGKTLYFSSKGHETMGGYDIFKSELENNFWSIPKNLGYPINTTGNDIFFVLSGDNKRGYYSSHREDGMGGQDIYVVSFENDFEQLRVFRGIVTDESNKPLSASLTLTDEEGETIGIYNTNAQTGKYIIVLPSDLDFLLNVESDGYATQEHDIHYKGGTHIKELERNFSLKIDQNQTP